MVFARLAKPLFVIGFLGLQACQAPSPLDPISPEPQVTEPSNSVIPSQDNLPGLTRIRPLTLPQIPLPLVPGVQLTLKAEGGLAPYEWSVLSGEATLSPAGELQVSALPDAQMLEVQVIDALGQIQQARWPIGAPPAYTPNDDYFDLQWSHQNTAQIYRDKMPAGAADADSDSAEAWARNRDCSSILIGIIDTGVDLDHPDFLRADGTSNLAQGLGYDFVDDSPLPQDRHYHGTHVAGIIGAAGDNTLGVTGVCPKAQLVAYRFLGETNEGFASDAAIALRRSISDGVKIINASWGGKLSEPELAVLKDAFDEVEAAGILVVAGAGNLGEPIDFKPFYPASFPNSNILVVGATDAEDKITWFSNWGSGTIDLFAPGQSILSTVPTPPTPAMGTARLHGRFSDSSYTYLDGTSMATPFVSGAAALLWSQHPDWNASDITDQLNGTVDLGPVGDGFKDLRPYARSGGRINVARALFKPKASPSEPRSNQALVLSNPVDPLANALTRQVISGRRFGTTHPILELTAPDSTLTHYAADTVLISTSAWSEGTTQAFSKSIGKIVKIEKIGTYKDSISLKIYKTLRIRFNPQSDPNLLPQALDWLKSLPDTRFVSPDRLLSGI